MTASAVVSRNVWLQLKQEYSRAGLFLAGCVEASRRTFGPIVVRTEDREGRRIGKTKHFSARA
jgi:hypothetical protein